MKEKNITVLPLGKRHLGTNLKKAIRLLGKSDIVISEQRNPIANSLTSFCQILTINEDESTKIKEKLKKSGIETVQEYSPQTHPEIMIITAYKGYPGVLSSLA